MGLRSRNKGKRGEREAAKQIERLFNVSARRGCQFAGGDDSPDIKTAIKDVHFEVKRSESLRLYDAMAQATDDSNGKVPVVLHRENRKQWLAIIPLEDLPRLSTQLYLTLAETA